MGTRSLIGRERADGTVGYIYCHWDGYVSHNGRILFHHYRDPAKLEALLALGSISALGPEIGEKHPFDDYNLPEEQRARAKGWTTAYGRDRGEDDVSMVTSETVDAYWNSESWAEYRYLMRADGQWVVCGDGTIELLAKALDLSAHELLESALPT